MYCEVEQLEKSLPNNFFDSTSLIDSDELERLCGQISAGMDTKFLAAGHVIPLDADYVNELLAAASRGGGGDPPGPKVMEAVNLAAMYGTRQLVFSTLATDDDEASQLASMNGELFDVTMTDILKALSGEQVKGATSYGSASGGRREPIIKLRDSGLW